MSLFGLGKKKEEVKIEPACACNGEVATYEASSCCCGGQQVENCCGGDNKLTIDMETNGQYSKLITDIPDVDIAISMGCNVGCPFIGRPFDDNWGLDDPTGKDDVDFIKVIREIEERIIKLKNSL